MKHRPFTNLSYAEVLSRFQPEHRAKVRELSGLRGAEGIVVFENLNPSSPQFGKKTALAVGPTLTHKTVAEFKGGWLGSDDTRQDAVAFCLLIP